jgi:hypothetical protein
MRIRARVGRGASSWPATGMVGGLMLAGLLAWPAAAQAQKPLRKELAEVAVVVAKHLRQRSKTIAVGGFRCDNEPPTNHGPGICLALGEELARQGLQLDRKAGWLVQGVYKVIIDTSTSDRHPALKLEIELQERDGDGGFNLHLARAVVDEETVAAALGLTLALPAEGSGADRARELDNILRNDRAPQITGGRVSVGKDSPYGVEVLVQRDGRYEPITPRLVNNVAYAPVARKEVYALRLYNDTPHEAAASVTIDGIDLFSFCDVKPTSLILPPRGSAVVRGWPITLERTNEFQVTAYAESAAFQLQSLAPVGVINVAFAAAWPRDGTPPPDEPRRAPQGSRAGDATGHGASIGQKYVALERKIGVLRASVSVRYTR